MAMNGTNMGLAVAAAIRARWDNAPRSHELDNDYSIEELWKIICIEIVNHIKNNAKCSGTDSHGDSHDNVGVV